MDKAMGRFSFSLVCESTDHFLLIKLFLTGLSVQPACTQDEINKVMESAKAAQKLWAKTPLWKRVEALHKAAAILKENKGPIAECLVKEVAKPMDSITQVVRSGDLISYTAEAGVRILVEGKFLASDSVASGTLK